MEVDTGEGKRVISGDSADRLGCPGAKNTLPRILKRWLQRTQRTSHYWARSIKSSGRVSGQSPVRIMSLILLLIWGSR